MSLGSTFVKDDEILYRCIFTKNLNNKNFISEDSSGTTVIGSQAFADTKFQPSVDRASLRECPSETQQESTDAVIQLLCQEVREIDDVVQNDPQGGIKQSHRIDVKHRPEDNNYSHSQIEASPNYANKKVFRKLRIKLGFLATRRLKNFGWVIEPKY